VSQQRRIARAHARLTRKREGRHCSVHWWNGNIHHYEDVQFVRNTVPDTSAQSKRLMEWFEELRVSSPHD
jgi:uncharacterized protein involved in tolerance to divalent cations